MVAEFDREFAIAECSGLRSLVIKYVEIVATTERLALAGAAAFAVYSVSGLGAGLERTKIFTSLIPFLVVSLAGLRCLTLHFVIASTLTEPAIGLQRNAKATGPFTINRAVEAVSGGFWALAVLAALLFWLLVNDII